MLESLLQLQKSANSKATHTKTMAISSAWPSKQRCMASLEEHKHSLPLPNSKARVTLMLLFALWTFERSNSILTAGQLYLEPSSCSSGFICSPNKQKARVYQQTHRKQRPLTLTRNADSHQRPADNAYKVIGDNHVSSPRLQSLPLLYRAYEISTVTDPSRKSTKI